MGNIDVALKKIKENPEKYIKKKSIKALDLFICGYVLSERSEGEYIDRFSEFQKFVQNKYNIRLAKSFSEIILFYSATDKIAFENFYEILEEFYKEGGVL